MSTIDRYDAAGNLISSTPIPLSPAAQRREAAITALQGARPLLRQAITQIEADQAIIPTATAAQVRAIVERALERERRTLLALRRLLLVTGADGDDGEA